MNKAEEWRLALTHSPHFHSGSLTVSDDEPTVAVIATGTSETFRQTVMKSRAPEYTDRSHELTNTENERFQPSRFRARRHRQVGWTVRFRIDNRWFWILHDGSISNGSVGGSELDSCKLVVALDEQIPHLPVNQISTVVFVAVCVPVESKPGSGPESTLRKIIGKVRRT